MNWRTLTRNIPFWIAVGAIAGLGLGLLVGWVLWPVEYTDTDPNSLRERHQKTWVEMVADSYQLSGDLVQAQARLYELEGKGRTAEDVAAFVAQIAAQRKAEGQVDTANRLQALATALGAEIVPPAISTPAPSEEVAEKEPIGARLKGILRICLIPIFIVLVIAGLLIIWAYLRGRLVGPRLSRRTAPPRERPLSLETPTEAEAEAEEQEWPTPQIQWDVVKAELALGHFVTTFELGDDGYDESFGIETETGEFLGECGVAISELVAPGSPEKPTAFDIWLFDKSDIRTVTAVVASPHAFEDEALHAKLGAKGDVFLAQKGQAIELETASLQVRAEIVDLSYGSGEAPDSYFTRFTVELSPSRKATE